MKNITIPHQAISASAGSGKTFQLAHRYIQLMANGVSVDRIIALTFSRKASGEIFDSIVKYLSNAAASPQQASKTSQLINAPHLSQADFLQLLRGLLLRINRLHISTLDSFTVNLLRVFPMELGTPMQIQVMDNEGATAKTARQEVLDRLLHGQEVNRQSQSEFLEAFRQATFGREEKGLERSLNTFISQYRTYYHTIPSPKAWGNPDVIWTEDTPWLTHSNNIDEIISQLEVLVANDELPPTIIERWNTFLEAARRFDPNSPWTRELEYMFGKLVDDMEGLTQGHAHIKIERTKTDLSPEECKLVLAIIAHIMQTEINSALERTRGIYRVLESYDQFYNEMMRSQGKLTFSDAQYLLTPANRYSCGALLSQDKGRHSHLYISYRLDCILDHWLLDEFQDTSDLQWEVLRNLANEILTDDSGRRSYFYVGDVKQAIYGWRGGNAGLFGKILEHYEDKIQQLPMNTSFRSAQPIIDTVNRVFHRLPEHQLPSGAITQWRQLWQDHRCQHGVVPKHGYAALIEPKYSKEDAKPTDEDRYHATACLLNKIKPLERGLSTALLVRSNEHGKELANFLRQECPDMPIVHEGTGAIEDNPVVSVLLSLIKFAAHPGDTFAWRHLQMSPLGTYLIGNAMDTETLPLMLLKEIQMFGFQHAIISWGNRLQESHPLDAFGRKRLKDLSDAAAQFDSDGNRDCNTFLHFIDNYDVHEIASDEAVRVMTVHQSKGLGFDMVILPDLQGRSITEAGDIDFVMARAPETNQPTWALRMPRKMIAMSDPCLAYQIQVSNDSACFDSLCVLYVALTRAKQGLYMITSFPGNTAKTITSATFLKTQLSTASQKDEAPSVSINGEEFDCLYETGDRCWHEKAEKHKPRSYALPSPPPITTIESPPYLRNKLIQILPSDQVIGDQDAGELFSCNRHTTLDFGTAIHELFEKVYWIDQTDIQQIVQDWSNRSSTDGTFKDNVIEEFRSAISSPAVQQALSRPKGKTRLWREKRFDVIIDNQWISGAFDRVTIICDSKGNVAKAVIMDLKSDAITSDTEMLKSAEGYYPQLELYRKALSQMLKIDSSQITLQLLFTHLGKVHTLS
ncbi:MAG: UvrD-helicase domain-containing protein [Chloroflexota bacterium]|nr:UvrD-helicase domain-containing protein [Chloroflexota bacterium]